MKKSAKLMMAMLLVVLLVVTLVACGKPDTGGTGTTDTKYTIAFDCNGGSAVADMIVDGKTEITVPTTTKDGYYFAGWFVDNDTFQIPFDLAYITANPTLTSITVYAKWIKETSAEFFEFTYTDKTNTSYSIKKKVDATLPNEVVLPSSYNGAPVTSIGEYAFFKCSGLTKVTMPASVTSIGEYAFFKCSGLTSMTIGSGVTSIESMVFSDCTSLTSIAIPKSVTKIQESAFYNCSGLISVEVEKGNTAYHSKDNCTIETANGLLILGCKNSIIPTDGSVVGIGQGAFSYSGLTSISIPASVTSIEKWAFAYCGELTSIAIPASVTYIGDGAFSYCNKLTSITVDKGNTKYRSAGNCLIETETKALIAGCKDSIIPTDGSVTMIESFAFAGCSAMTSITIPTSVLSIEHEAFANCSKLTSIAIPASVNSVGYKAFENFNAQTKIYFEVSCPSDSWNLGWQTDCNATPVWGYNNITTDSNYDYVLHEDEAYLTKYKGTETVVTIPNKIGGYPVVSYGIIFRGNKTLTSVTIPAGVTSVAGFTNCSELTSVTIPNSVTSIGEEAFNDCSKLTSIIIPDSVTSVGNYAFYKCGELTSVTIGSGVKSIGVSVFAYCIGLTSITIPATVTSIGDWAFVNCIGLTEITIPDSVASIGDYAFDGCIGLTVVTIPNNVASIGDYAFAWCTGLTRVTIGSCVKSIGESAFNGCSGLISVEVEKGNTAYHSKDNCIIETANGLLILGCKNSIIPTDGSVKSIDNSAFEGCSGLTSIIIPDSVTNIGNSAFSNCIGLTSITISNSVTNIGYFAFSGCSGLTSITIPSSVKSIGIYAFDDCTKLATINCKAASEPSGWDSDWQTGCNATVNWGYTGA